MYIQHINYRLPAGTGGKDQLRTMELSTKGFIFIQPQEGMAKGFQHHSEVLLGRTSPLKLSGLKKSQILKLAEVGLL